MRSRKTYPALTGTLLIALVSPGFATDPAGDSITYYAVARPQGPATASYLRMHHPLYLLDLCRQVKAGSRDREEVERLVGRNALDALLDRDLEALAEKLAGPAAAAGGPSSHSLWHRILTDDLAAPAPAPDVPESLDFHDVASGDFPTRILQVSSPADGELEARLPAGSPYQILSMRSYDGLIVQLPALPRPHPPAGAARGLRPAPRLREGGPQTYRSPEIARTEPPWVLPVRAGQDIDVLVGLPMQAAVEPGGTISSTLTVGDPLLTAWRQDVPILAQTAFKRDIKIRIDTPQPFIDFVEAPVIYPNTLYPFVAVLTLSNPNPPVKVKGTISALSLPQGISMSNFSFTLDPQQTINLALPLVIASYSPAWNLEEVPQAFSLQVSYQTTSPPLASRKEIVDLYFTIHPSLQTWRASSGGAVKCVQDVFVYSTGWTSRFGDCDNRNAFEAKVTAIGTLASITIVQVYYPLGWFDQKFSSSAGNVPYFQNNYVYVRGQPFLMKWSRN